MDNNLGDRIGNKVQIAVRIKTKATNTLSDELLLLFTQEGHITKESCN